MCRKEKVIVSKASNMSVHDPELGVKIMGIMVAEINAPSNNGVISFTRTISL